LARSSVDLNVITCGYLHEKTRAVAGRWFAGNCERGICAHIK
jgi:hypothetical protein